LITQLSSDGNERTWRRPVETRIAAAVCMAVFPALPGWWLGLTLVANRVPNGGWIALELGVAAWGILAWRTLAHSATLTRDTLVIRNILTTRRVPRADVTAMRFRRGVLTVTAAHGGLTAKRFPVSAVSAGSDHWSGLRCDADAAAEAISYALGLPPPPPRRQIISRNWARVMLVAAVPCFGVGVYCGPMQSGNISLPLMVRVAGGALYGLGIGIFIAACQVLRGHRRQRAR
jgi:hypothetical protein